MFLVVGSPYQKPKCSPHGREDTAPSQIVRPSEEISIGVCCSTLINGLVLSESERGYRSRQVTKYKIQDRSVRQTNQTGMCPSSCWACIHKSTAALLHQYRNPRA